MAAYSFNQFNQRGNPSNPDQDQVALFIDWDNLVISNYADRGGNRPDLEVLVRRAQQYGTVVIARAYAEWNITADRLEVYKSGIEPIYAPVFHADRDLGGQTSRGKSLADPVMVTDCIDFLHLLPQVGTYVLVTGDKDMVPVVRLARLRGRRVVVIGPDYVANVLQQVSDEFIPYRFLLAQVVNPADPYAAAYYQQTGQYPPTATPPQGYFPPPATAQAQQQPAPTTDRRGRRLSGRRGQSSYAPPIQPYARIVAPPPTTGQPQTQPQAQAPQQPPYGYYGLPGQAQPGAAYQPAQQQQPPQVDPFQQVAQAQPQPQTGQYPGNYGGQQPPAAQTTEPTVQRGAYQPQQSPAQPQTAYSASSPAQPQPTTPTPTAEVKSAPAAQGSFDEIKDVISQIITLRAASGRPQMRARDLKEELLRRIPNFSERRYGFSKFKALLNAAETANVLQIDQSGHILWVSAPGTPKMQFNSTLESAAGAVETDEDEDSDTETTSPAVEAELSDQDEQGAEATPEALTNLIQTVEPEEAAIVASEADMQLGTNAPLAEERTTSLVEAPIGAHRPQPVARPTESGQRPALLDQPHYENVIVLIDELRNRNRWLGYELLLSNVRDLLAKEMPEAEAKVQAGVILSKLLQDGIIKMAVEVHSRGARKMTVKVAHLQESNSAVRYVLDNRKAGAAVAEPGEAETQAEPIQEAATLATDTDTVSEAPTQEAEAAQPSYDVPDYSEWGSHYTRQAQPEAITTEYEATEASDEPAQVAEQAAQPDYAEVAEPGQFSETEAAQPVQSNENYYDNAADVYQQPESTQQFEEVREEVHSAEQSESVQAEAPHGEVNGYEVDAPIAETPATPGDAGEGVQGEPEQAQPDEEPAPAGGFHDTVELEAAPTQEHTNGNGHQQVEVETEVAPQAEADSENKQPVSETLQPVAELDGDEAEESEAEESEAEGDVVAPKGPTRRPRRRRTPAPKPEGQGESMGQPTERRPRLSIALRPPRHRNR